MASLRGLSLLLSAASLGVLAAIPLDGQNAAAFGDPMALSRISLDAKSSGSWLGGPANTATSVGHVEPAVGRINVNGIVDADEDFVDAVQIDVVTWYPGAPAANPLTQYEYTLNYPQYQFEVTSQTPRLLDVNAGSSIANGSDALPDTDGTFDAAVTDGGPIPSSAESGEGVLDSLIVKAAASAFPSVDFIYLSNMLATGVDGTPRPPAAADVAVGIAVDIPFGFDDFDSRILDLDVQVPSEVVAGQSTSFSADSVFYLGGFGFDKDVTVTTTVTAPPDCTIDATGPGAEHVFMETYVAAPIFSPAPHPEQHDLSCLVPGPQTLIVESCVSIPFETFGGNQCFTENTPFDVLASSTLDSDSDGIVDATEYACGADFFSASERPERVDGPFTSVSDDGDVDVDEALPIGASAYDCDGDGYIGSAEDHVFSYAGQTDGDQKTCREYDANFSALDPNQTSATPSLRWPSDFRTGSIPDSTNKINILDLASFVVPVRYLGTDTGTNPGDVRWDISPGKGPLAVDINILDLAAMTAPGAVTGAPPMLGGVRAFLGPECPWPE